MISQSNQAISPGCDDRIIVIIIMIIITINVIIIISNHDSHQAISPGGEDRIDYGMDGSLTIFDVEKRHEGR